MKYKITLALLFTLIFNSAFSQKTLRDSLKFFTADLVQKAMRRGIKKLAVWDFTDINKDVSVFGRYIAEQFSIYAENVEGVELMDRQNLKTLLNEHQLKSEGFIDKNTIMELGKFKGVQAVAVGSVIMAGKNFQVVVKIIETSEGRTIAADEQFFQIDKNMEAILGIEQLVNPVGSNKKADSQRGNDLSGIWNFTIYCNYLQAGDGSMKKTGVQISGFLNLTQSGNKITGKYSNDRSADCKDGEITGTFMNGNIELEITCTKGSCIGSISTITGKYNNGTITGKVNPPQSNQPLKCRYFVGSITIRKQD